MKIPSSCAKGAVLAALALLCLGLPVRAHAKLSATANNDHISIDFFYHGSSVSVRGETDPGADLVIKIASPDGHQVLKRKGKVAGLLWMNTGELRFDHAPNFYEVFSTKQLDTILNVGERDAYLLGYAALAKHVTISPIANEEDTAYWFAEFIKFKEANKVYHSSVGTISLSPPANGRQAYLLTTPWPYQASPGDYLISVYAVKNGRVIDRAETTVSVAQVGLVKTLATMAKNNAAFYGILSIGIALGAGFGVGMVFKGGGAH